MLNTTHPVHHVWRHAYVRMTMVHCADCGKSRPPLKRPCGASRKPVTGLAEPHLVRSIPIVPTGPDARHAVAGVTHSERASLPQYAEVDPARTVGAGSARLPLRVRNSVPDGAVVNFIIDKRARARRQAVSRTLGFSAPGHLWAATSAQAVEMEVR